MPTLGYQSTFIPLPWSSLAERYRSFIGSGIAVGYLLAIVESVEHSPAAVQLAGTTSMHDLVVTNLPLDEPLEVVIVRAPGSLHPATSGIRIEHLSHTGRNDQIEGPEVDAVPLFWRFVIEKFGISPTG